jgi:molecular chaperone DnaK (HSP70)
MRPNSIEQVVRYIGIDFGTSTSAVFFKDYYPDGRPLHPGDAHPVMFDNSSMVPTIMFTDDAGHTHFGVDAGVRAQNYPERLRAEFKMSLLKSEDAGRQGQAEDLTRAFLKYLHRTFYQQATITESAKVKEARPYISYPAKWPAPVREMMIEAARQAGFERAEGMIEPEAAMRYFLAIRTRSYEQLMTRGIIVKGRPLTVLLVDMGAGTTDLVLYRFVPGGAQEILGSWPPIDRAERGAHLGGREIDEQLFSKVIESALPEGFLDEVGEEWAAQFRQDTKAWKEHTVSPLLREDGRIEDLPSNIRQALKFKGHEVSKVGLDRERFESLFEEYLEAFAHLVDGLVEHTKVEGYIEGGEDVDLVILTGGHSQWYFVEQMLTGKLPRIGRSSLRKLQEEPYRLLTGPYPQETVARGMALSGMPIRISKVAANNAWLNIRLGESNMEPLQIQKIGDLLPFNRQICTTVAYSFPSFDQQMPGLCGLVVGETLDGGKKFEPQAFAVPYKGFFKRLMQRVIPDDQADVCLDVHVDENERYAILGLVQSRRGKGYGHFSVNRRFPNDFERRKLADMMQQHRIEGG